MRFLKMENNNLTLKFDNGFSIRFINSDNENENVKNGVIVINIFSPNGETVGEVDENGIHSEIHIDSVSKFLNCVKAVQELFDFNIRCSSKDICLECNTIGEKPVADDLVFYYDDNGTALGILGIMESVSDDLKTAYLEDIFKDKSPSEVTKLLSYMLNNGWRIIK
jgi:hypothetical protein